MIRIAISQRDHFATAADFRQWLVKTLPVVDGLYLREKDWNDATYFDMAQWLLEHLPAGKRPLLILPFRPAFLKIPYAWIFQVGDSPQHLTTLRQTFGDRYRLLYSAHSLGEAKTASALGADFIFLSPIFATPSKPQASALGLNLLEQAVEEIPTPLIALGGITAENAHTLAATGAFGLAGIRLFQ